MNIKEIEIEQYDEFNQVLENYNLFQTSFVTLSRKYNYEDVKFLGLFRENKLVGTTQFLIEPLPFSKKKIATSIKGLNFDLMDNQLLRGFSDAMKEYIKKNNILFFRVDLNVAYKFYNRDFEEIDNILDFPHDNNIKNRLESFGYKEFLIDPNYMGRSPKWSMLVNLQDEKSLNSSLNRSVKRGINLAKSLGVEVIKTTKTKEDIEEFYKLHKLNAKKNNINIMDLGYYNELLKNEYIDLYLVKINKDKFLEYTTSKYDKVKNIKNESLLKLACEYDESYILGHITGAYQNIAYDMFTGLNYDYKDLGAKEYLMKTIFDNLILTDVKYYDFWGIVAGEKYKNDPMYPIYLFKKKFSNIIVEYPGFWDLTNSKILYNLYFTLYKYRYKKKH